MIPSGGLSVHTAFQLGAKLQRTLKIPLEGEKTRNQSCIEITEHMKCMIQIPQITPNHIRQGFTDFASLHGMSCVSLCGTDATGR